MEVLNTSLNIVLRALVSRIHIYIYIYIHLHYYLVPVCITDSMLTHNGVARSGASRGRISYMYFAPSIMTNESCGNDDIDETRIREKLKSTKREIIEEY